MKRQANADGEIKRDFLPEIAQIQGEVEQLRFQQRIQMYAHDDWLESMLREFASQE